jgi:pilus assembly protein CpaB
MVIVAVLIGLVAVVLASQWITQQTTSNSGMVVVARIDVNLGSKLTPEMLKAIPWPSGSIPSGALSDPQALEGRVLKVSVQRDEPLLESKLAPLGTKGGLSAVVAEGKRAITVRVNDVIGVAGFALPGNHVDILVNTIDDTRANTSKSNKDLTISKTVLEHILVLAVAQEATRDDTKPKVVNAVTLEVTPEQAEKLDLARSVGSLSLVLRNQVDSTPAETVGVTKRQLLHGEDPIAAAPASKPVARKRAPRSTVAAAPSAPEPERECVEIVRGMTRYTECF